MNIPMTEISEDLDDIKWLKSLEWLTESQQDKLKTLMNKYSIEEMETLESLDRLKIRIKDSKHKRLYKDRT